jgi:sortase A
MRRSCWILFSLRWYLQEYDHDERIADQTGSKLLKYLERLCITLGILGLVLTCGVYIDSYVGSRDAVAAFEQAADASPQPMATEPVPVISLPPVESPDRQSIETNPVSIATTDDEAPVALLIIQRLDVEVPVFPGTDPASLNRGVGIVAGSALPGEKGNVAVAGHRDSFFRPLKDIEVGDIIELRSATGKQRYGVSEVFITDPLDVSVLDATIASTLTLITCYPFHYVGFAPDRYIVRALPESNSNTQLNVLKP